MFHWMPLLLSVAVAATFKCHIYSELTSQSDTDKAQFDADGTVSADSQSEAANKFLDLTIFANPEMLYSVDGGDLVFWPKHLGFHWADDARNHFLGVTCHE